MYYCVPNTCIETWLVLFSLQNTEHFAMLGLGDIVSNLVTSHLHHMSEVDGTAAIRVFDLGFLSRSSVGLEYLL